MRKRRLPVLFGLPLLLGIALASWGRAPLDTPRGFDLARGDAQLVRLAAPDGRVWAAWSYDAGAESDLAVAARSVDGIWSEPIFVGTGDGMDQTHPTLAMDARGNLYLACGVRNGASIALSIRSAATGTWSAPARISPVGEFASRPTMRVIGDRLVVSYRTAAGSALRDFPLLQEEATPNGIQDGPDILPPTGNNSGGGPVPVGGGDPFRPVR